MKAEVQSLLDVLSSRPGANEDYMKGAADLLSRRLTLLPAMAGDDYRRGWREAMEIRPYAFEQRREPAKFSTIDSNAWKQSLARARAHRAQQNERMAETVQFAAKDLRQRLGESRWNELLAKQAVAPAQETMRLRF